jgi:predicted DNA-binding protein (MmcQ/YjbR family)
LLQFEPPGLPDGELKAHIEMSYDMIAAALPKKTRSELGL